MAGDGVRPGVSPWPGLAAYSCADADRYFGRGRVTRQLVRLLRERRVAGVVGPSGSGKSSLVAAGLASAGFDVEVVRPGLDGLPGRAVQPSPAVLVVDQLEEVFTVLDSVGRHEFLDRLGGIIDRGGTVAFALRSDYYGACAGYPQLADMVAGAHVLIGPPTEDELREIVAGPAERLGWTVPADLVNEIVDEVVGEPGALPLVSHALAETVRASPRGELTWDAYRQAGGVRGSIARTAEVAWSALPAHLQQAARAVLVDLAAPPPGAGEGLLDAARRRPLSELTSVRDPDRRAAIDALVAARLVTIDGTNVEIAHEAVFREWPRLRDWLIEDRQLMRSLGSVRQAAHIWHGDGRPDEELLRGLRLQTAQHVTRRPDLVVDDVVLEFVDRSAAAADEALRAAEQGAAAIRRTNRALRMSLAAVAVLTVVAIIAAGLAWRRADDAAAERDIADARRLAAASSTLRADNIDVAALTAAEAFDLHADDQTVGAMLSAGTAQIGLAGYLHDDLAFTAATLSGELLAIDDSDTAVGVWDLAQVPPRRVGEIVTGPDVAPADVGFVTADVLVVTDAAGGVAAYRARSAERLWVSSIAPAQPTSLAVGGSIVAVGDDSGTVTTFDTADGSVLAEVTVSDAVAALAFSSDGGRLAVATATDVTEFAAPAWDRARAVTTLDGEIWSVAYSLGDEFLLIGTDVDLRVVDPSDGMLVTEPIDAHGGGIVHDIAVVAGADATSVAVSAGEDGRVAFTDVASGAEVRAPLAGHGAGVLAVAVDPASAWLVTAGEDLRAGLWRLDGRTPVSTPLVARSSGTPADGIDAALAAAASGLVAVAGRDGTLRFSADDRGALPGPIEASADPLSAVTLTEDGTRVAVATQTGSVQVFDVATGVATTPVLTVGARVASLAIDPLGTLLAAAETDAECVACTVVFDLRDPSREPLRLSPAARPEGDSARPGYAVAFDPSGTLLAAGDNAGYVDVWRVSHDDGPAVVSQWSIKLERGIRALAFSADGDQLAIGANGGLLAVVASADGRELQRLNGHRGRVAGAAFSPDGRLLATTGPDEQRVRVWVLASGLPFSPAIPTGLEATATPAWSSDGRDLLVSLSTGAVAFHVDAARLRDAMCVLAGRDLTRREWSQYVGSSRAFSPTCGDR